MRETVAMAAQRDAAILGVGRLSGDEVYKHYAAADVLILPSSREPWGLVVNEAMAAGLPVIVSDRVGSATDLVEGRGTGIVIPHDDVAALTSAMATLAQDQLGRERMAQAAKALIAQWDMRNWAKNIVSAWQTLRKK
jgi:glycosyltransferase involved in cell wall biosynthesis